MGHFVTLYGRLPVGGTPIPVSLPPTEMWAQNQQERRGCGGECVCVSVLNICTLVSLNYICPSQIEVSGLISAFGITRGCLQWHLAMGLCPHHSFE